MTVIVGPGAAAVGVLDTFARCPAVAYDYGVDLVDLAGDVLGSLNPVNSSSTTPATVERDTKADVPGRFDFTLDTELTWGSDIVAPYLLISSPHAYGGDPRRFPLGFYVVTSPSVPLKARQVWNVTAYSLPYLLQGDVGDNFSVAPGATYESAVGSLLTMAGVPSPLVGGHLNPAVVTVTSPDWAAKVVPASGQGAGPLVYPCDDSNTYTFLQIINELLKASGMNPISDTPTGTFLISPIVQPGDGANRWTFSIDPTEWDAEFSQHERVISAQLNTDAWNLPNRVVYIQNGLTFAPTANDGSDGRFVIDNAPDSPYYRPPVDQASVGRIIKQIVRLDASGQADLIAQAKLNYLELYGTAETFDLSSAPWPAAWERDEFRVASSYLPRTNQRKVRATSWTLSLRGDPMTWALNSVSEG